LPYRVRLCALHSFPTRRSSDLEFSMTTEELKQYAGLYQTLEGHEVHVTCYNGRLFIEQDSGSIRLCPCAANEFVMQSGKKIVFTVDAHQDVTGIFRGMRWLPKMKNESLNENMTW